MAFLLFPDTVRCDKYPLLLYGTEEKNFDKVLIFSMCTSIIILLTLSSYICEPTNLILKQTNSQTDRSQTSTVFTKSKKLACKPGFSFVHFQLWLEGHALCVAFYVLGNAGKVLDMIPLNSTKLNRTQKGQFIAYWKCINHQTASTEL